MNIWFLIASFLGWIYLSIRAKRRIRQGFISRVPYIVRGGGGDDDEPQVKQVPFSESQQLQEQLFKEIQAPFARRQFELFKDVFEPQMRTLGGILGKEITSPSTLPALDFTKIPELPQITLPSLGAFPELKYERFNLPEDEYARVFQKARERTVGEFTPIRQQATERAAGRGMLGQGPTERYMQSLDLAQAKSVEDIAVDMAIQEWQDKKQSELLNWQQGIQATGQNWQANLQNILSNWETGKQTGLLNWQQGIDTTLKNIEAQRQSELLNWQQAITGKQLPIENIMRYLGQQPQFNISPATPQYISSMPGQGGSPFGSALGGAGMGALAGLALAVPTGGLSIPMGLGLGAGLGGLSGLGGYYGGR